MNSTVAAFLALLWAAWVCGWTLGVMTYRRRVVRSLRYYADLLGPNPTTPAQYAVRAYADKLEETG